jgi:phosphoserine aminotransferase
MSHDLHLFQSTKAVFSTGPTDLRYTRLVEHEINLTDDKPYREPYRRIPPSVFDEVREHLREMLNVLSQYQVFF